MKTTILSLTLIFGQPCFASAKAQKAMGDKIDKAYEVEEMNAHTVFSPLKGFSKDKILFFSKEFRNLNQMLSKLNFTLALEIMNAGDLTKVEKEKCMKDLKVRYDSLISYAMGRLDTMAMLD